MSTSSHLLPSHPASFIVFEKRFPVTSVLYFYSLYLKYFHLAFYCETRKVKIITKKNVWKYFAHELTLEGSKVMLNISECCQCAVLCTQRIVSFLFFSNTHLYPFLFLSHAILQISHKGSLINCCPYLSHCYLMSFGQMINLSLVV